MLPDATDLCDEEECRRPGHRYISATLTAVKHKSKLKNLAFAEAILHLDSPEIEQKIPTHQFVAQLVRTSENISLSKHVRTSVTIARHELHSLKRLDRLVPDLYRPLKPKYIRTAREKEWARALEVRNRRQSPPRRGKEKLS